MDNGGFYITAKISFNSLKELVQHHSRAYSLLRGLTKIIDCCGGGSSSDQFQTCLPSLSSRRCRWVVHKAGEAVPVEGTAEALVAGWVGDSPWVPEAGAQARSRTVWRSLDGWVLNEIQSFNYCFAILHIGVWTILHRCITSPVAQSSCGFDCVSARKPLARIFFCSVCRTVSSKQS